MAGLDGLTKGTDPDQALNLSDQDLWDRDTPEHLVVRMSNCNLNLKMPDI